jgi:dipeptidyl-peptidase 4
VTTPRRGTCAVTLALALAGCQGPAPRPASGWPPPFPAQASVAALEAQPALDAYVATRRYRLGQPAEAKATPDGKTVVYLASAARSDLRSLWAFDVASGKVRQLATAESLSGQSDHALTAEEAAQRERMRLTATGLGTFSLSDDGRTAVVPFGGKIYLVAVSNGKATPLPAGEGADFDPQLSPDGKALASIENDELYVRALPGGAAKRLTHGAGKGLTHGEAEFVAQEEMDRFTGFWWSPDSKRLAYEEADSSKVEPFYLLDVAHGERAPEGSPYPRPGKPNVAVKLGVISRSGGKTRWISWDQTRYPYLARVEWPEGGPLLLQVQTRDQKELVLLEANPDSGKTQTLLTEKDAAWVNLTDDLRWLPKSHGFLWSSDRSGQAELELHKADGSLAKVLTEPVLGFRQLVAVNEAAGYAVVEAAAYSTEQALYEIPLAGGPAQLIAGGPAVHSATGTDDGPILVDHEAQLDQPARTMAIQISDGKVFGELPDQAERPRQPPRVELAQLPTPIGILESAVILPHDFDPSRRYPVVDWVYGGPGVVEVEKDEAGFALQQWLADQGVVVVKIDNRGTPRRGRDFERAIKGSFAELPLADQVAGLQALGATRPYLDLGRVGIIGASFGGYLAALAVLRRPDIFKAAVAIAPVVDWEDYDTHYTERYLSTPEDNADGYRQSSLLMGAASLSRPLLLVHGTADDNVHIVGTLKLLSALEGAGKAPDLFVVPGQTHMFAEQATQRLLWARSAAFLLDHLSSSLMPSLPSTPSANAP